ncbi:MAG: methylamine dehydrogenase [Pseudomonadota bacterium]
MEQVLLVAVVGLWMAVIALGFAVFALARQIGVLHERIAPAGALMMNERLKVGEPAPQVDASMLSGDVRKIGRGGGRSLLLFFLSPTCPVCKTLLPAVQTSESAEADWLDVVYASDGEGEGHAALARTYGLNAEAYAVSEPLGRAFGVSKLPYAVLLDGEGCIASMGLVNSREHIESLFNAKETGVISLQAYMRGDGASNDAAAKA